MSPRPDENHPRSAPVPPLDRCSAHVWVVPLSGDEAALYPTLSPAERVRAARRVGEERSRFVVSHGAVRDILGRYLGQAATDVMVETPYGAKPGVPGLELSLAHANDIGLVAVAHVAVGIDVESVADLPLDELDDLAEFSLSAREFAALQALPREQQLVAFFRSWTRKEAYLKSIGQGIGDRAFAEIEVTAGDAPPALLAADGDEITNLTLLNLEPAVGYVGAVAIACATAQVETLTWRAPGAVRGRR